MSRTLKIKQIWNHTSLLAYSTLIGILPMLVLTSWFLYYLFPDDVCNSFDNHVENVYNSITDTTNNSSNINQKVENLRDGLNNLVPIIMFLVSLGGFATDIKTGFNITFDTEDELGQNTNGTSSGKRQGGFIDILIDILNKVWKTIVEVFRWNKIIIKELKIKLKDFFLYLFSKIIIPTIVIILCDLIFCLLFWGCHKINTRCYQRTCRRDDCQRREGINSSRDARSSRLS